MPEVELLKNDTVLFFVEENLKYTINDIKERGDFLKVMTDIPLIVKHVYLLKGLVILLDLTRNEIISVMEEDTRTLVAMCQSGQRGFEMMYNREFSLDEANRLMRDHSMYGN